MESYNFKDKLKFWEHFISHRPLLMQQPQISNRAKQRTRLDLQFYLNSSSSVIPQRHSTPTDTYFSSYRNNNDSSNNNNNNTRNNTRTCDQIKFNHKSYPINFHNPFSSLKMLSPKLSYLNTNCSEEDTFISESIQFKTSNSLNSKSYVAKIIKEAKVLTQIDYLLEKMILLYDSQIVQYSVNTSHVNPYTFFLAYKWLGVSTEILACKLRFHYSYELEFNQHNRLKELSLMKPSSKTKKIQVCNLFSYWVQTFIEDFPKHSLVNDLFRSLNSFLTEDNTFEIILNGIYQLESQIPKETADFNTCVSNSIMINGVNCNSIDFLSLSRVKCQDENFAKSFLILELETLVLAKCIIWIEFSLFKEITYNEFKQYSKAQNARDCDIIQKCIKQSNSIAVWIQNSILSEEAPDARALQIGKFIDLAFCVHELNAFQTLMCIIGSLNSGCVCPTRLSLTWPLVPKEKLSKFENLTATVSMYNNYMRYRQELDALKLKNNLFYFPILGVIFKDLICIDVKDVFSTDSENFLITLEELRINQLAKTIETWRKSQQSSIDALPDSNRIELVKAEIQLSSCISEDDLYQKTFIQEPRDLQKDTTVFLKEEDLFSYFIKDPLSKTIDNTIFKQHVMAISKYIFITYDKNNNGYICMDEFSEFEKDFNLYENFNLLDINKDGEIGPEEIYAFTLKSLECVSCHFVHTFKDYHDFYPATCSQCKSVLWCPFDTGSKCKNCDLVCHKGCRDKLISQCKKKTNSFHRNKIHRSVKDRNRIIKCKHNETEDLPNIYKSVDIAASMQNNTKFSFLTEELPNYSNDNTRIDLNCSLEKAFKSSTLYISMEEELNQLKEENQSLKDRFNATLSLVFNLKSDKRILESKFKTRVESLINENFELERNNTELQRQFAEVRNATGQFIFNQVAILNSSQSATEV